nr:KilA [Vector p5231]QVT77280.1 KilA [Vector p2118]QVT77288.1 KilA [Vector p5010]
MQQTFNADMNISNLHQNVDPSTTLSVICGVEITTDRAGRYNLNALHRASGLGAHKAPAQWLRTLSAKQLIEELEKETMQNCIVSFTSNGSRISFTTRITGKGQQWLMKRLLDAGVLVPVAATR